MWVVIQYRLGTWNITNGKRTLLVDLPLELATKLAARANYIEGLGQ